MNFNGLKVRHLLWSIGVIALILWFVANFYIGERIQHNNGLGWDGATYAEWAQQGPKDLLISRSVDEYYTGRMLPSILIHYSAKILNFPLGDATSPAGVIHAFYVFDCVLLLVCVVIFGLIAKHFKWTPPIFALGFVALFINFPTLKLVTYNPTLTDVSAFTLGLLTFYLYLKNRTPCLILSSVIASFTFPPMVYAALPLIVFRVEDLPIGESKPNMVSNIMAWLVGLFVVGNAAYYYYYVGIRYFIPGTPPINDSLVMFSAALLAIYVFLALRQLVDTSIIIEQLKKGVSIPRVLFAALLFILVKLIVFSFSNHEPGPVTAWIYLVWAGQSGIKNPLTNIVSHVNYFGPVFLLTVFLWDDVARIIKSKGLGLTIFVSIYAVLSVAPESRQHSAAWPVLALLTCEALNRRGIDWYFANVLIVSSVIISRFWLNLNVGTWTGEFQKFPDQMLFMNVGSWMSNTMYSVFAAVTILVALLINALLRLHRADQGRADKPVAHSF